MAAHQIFSRLINTLVVEMMQQPDMAGRRREERMNKSPAIAYFEAVCSFWRT